MSPAAGAAIRRLRERQGLTQRELAAKADLDHSYISRIESGVAENPSGRVLRDIAAALGTNLASLERSRRR